MSKASTVMRRPQVRRHIEEKINAEKLWGRRLPPYRRLAREIGCSGRTLQLTLAEMEAEGLVESRHGSGTYVLDRTERQRRVEAGRLVVIVRDYPGDMTGSGYKQEMVRGATGKVARLGGSCDVLSLSAGHELPVIRSKRHMREFDGFILVGVNEHDLIHHLLKLRRGPVVLVDSAVRGMPVVSVTDDSFGGARAVTRHLLGLGHRRIAFIDIYDSAERNADKFGGYKAALSERGLEFDEGLVESPTERERPKLAGLEKFIDAAVEKFLKMRDAPTAIFAFNDARALMAMAALKRRGVEAGRDISLAGFGDRAFRAGKCEWLTSCRIYARKMGQEAVRAALERGNTGEGRSIIVPTRLMVRSSSCAPKGT
jgi:DNA-binding LacI/PurR family transcriptional regulator